MNGILKLAYKLLVNDPVKFSALLVGNAFAVFGMMFATWNSKSTKSAQLIKALGGGWDLSQLPSAHDVSGR